MEGALILCTSTSRGLDRLWLSSWGEDLKCFHAHSVENCRFENVKFGPNTSIGRIFLPPYFMKVHSEARRSNQELCYQTPLTARRAKKADRVMLNRKNSRTKRPMEKLDPKMFGRKIGSRAYELELPVLGFPTSRRVSRLPEDIFQLLLPFLPLKHRQTSQNAPKLRVFEPLYLHKYDTSKPSFGLSGNRMKQEAG